jgi:hypothetical protein
MRVRTPKEGFISDENLVTPRSKIVADKVVEGDESCHTSVDGDVTESFQSQDDHSHELGSRATSYTHSTRKSRVSHKPAAMDRAAQWLIESLKGLVANSSADSDDHERHTTFSQSTGYDVDMSATATEDHSTMSDEHRQVRSKHRHIAVQQLYTAISGLSEVMSQDTDQGTSISKDVCEDLKRVLAIARQLKMKPEDLVERIAAGDSIEKLIDECHR